MTTDPQVLDGTLANIIAGTAGAYMEHEEAQRVTERIRLTLDSASRALDRLAALVADAYERRADLALGYGSWAEYSEAEFAEQTRNLAAPIRRELVGYLSASGMSTRAIAPAVGVSPRQAAYDRSAGVQELHTSSGPTEHIDLATGEVITHQTPTTSPSPDRREPQHEAVEPTADRRVVGLDGKSYTRPELKPERRRPLPDAFGEGVYQLRLKVETLDRLTRDDRFAANKEKTAQTELRRLINTRDLLEQVIDQLS